MKVIAKKWRQFVSNWRHLAVVTSTGQISTFFLDDLKKLAYYM